MRGSRFLVTAAVSLGATVAATLGMAAPAHACADCTDYPIPPQVAGVAVQRDVPQQAPQVLPLQVQAAEPARQALPVTGTDVVEIAGLGFVLLGTGTVLVRRTKRRA